MALRIWNSRTNSKENKDKNSDYLRQLKKPMKFSGIQYNDTHPVMMILELIRILLDEEFLPFDKTFDLFKKDLVIFVIPSCRNHYKNDPHMLFEKFFPRHLYIISEINETFLSSMKLFISDRNQLAAMVKETLVITLYPQNQLFDAQIKRIHEYKRQTLSLFSAIDRYLFLVENALSSEKIVPELLILVEK